MNKKTKWIIGILFAAVALLAAVYLMTREHIPEGALAIRKGEKTAYVSLDKKELQQVNGTLINGKGEEKQVNAMGVPLKTVLKNAKALPEKSVTVTADDAFSAEVAAEELEENKAFLIAEEDGSVTLVVFGDSNSKRNVRKVVSIDVQ